MRATARLPYLLLGLASLVAAPVFTRGLPCSDDTLPHLYRAVQFDLLVGQGAPFLQWGPDLMRGYGYPIFAFYAPLSYWLVELLHLLGLDFAPALQVAFFIALPLAATGAYHLAGRYLATAGAFVAGLAYLFAPYLLYDAVQRGALPETLALALLPWALAAIEDAHRQATIRAALRAAVLFSLLLLTHNVVPLFGLALALGLAIFSKIERVTEGEGAGEQGSRGAGGKSKIQNPKSQIYPLASLLLALTLTAFFWLPVLVELPYTQSRRPDPPFRDWPRVEQHLLPLTALVEWPDDPADPHLLNPPVSRTLGIAQVALAVLGLFGIFIPSHHDRRRTIADGQDLPPATCYLLPAVSRASLAVWGLITLAAVYLSSQLSGWWWGHLPPLHFIQLPTRFLGPASLGLAILAGAGTEALWRMAYGLWRHPSSSFSLPPSSLTLALPALVVALSGWPWLYPPYCPVPTRPDQAALAQATVWMRWRAEAQGEVLPRWVGALPPENGLITQYTAGAPVNRLLLPAGGQILAWEGRPAHDRYSLELAAPATAVYQSFYFPGWRVRLDGRPLPIRITHPEGLISFELPAGQHTLEVSFGRTPIRITTLVVSGLAAGLTLWAWWVAKDEGRPTTQQARHPSEKATHLWALTFTLTLILLAKFALVDRLSTPIRADRLHDGQLSGLSQPAAISFSGEFLYLGYDGPEEAQSGAPFDLTQYWAPQRNIGVPYWFTVQVADEAGNVWNRPPELPFGYAGYPGPPGWLVGGYARDPYRLTLLPGTPPGEYWIEARAFRADVDLDLIPLGAATGRSPAHARVGRLRVTPGDFEVTADKAALDTYAPHAIPAAPGLTLLGWSLSTATLRPGDRAHVELLWQSADSDQVSVNGHQLPIINNALPMTLVLFNGQGQTVLRHSFSPGGAAYPLDQWPAGSLVRDQLNVRLPAALVSGRYQAQVEVDGRAIASLGFLQVDAPERVFSRPPVATRVDVQWAFARLTGYTLSAPAAQPGQSVNLDLLWQAAAETETNYRVFVHLRDANGLTITQADGEPVHWTRPTGGWLPGEYILDSYTLTIPSELAAGVYDLFVGLYNPADGRRLGEARLAGLEVRPP
ncbi:MAG: 6-pyruvoyl-tetrahydropterin synthase-related protein [Chloroflexota bacterium]